MLKNNKGITLIALVITIIVLLILAGVSIAMLTGGNGLLTKAAEARVSNYRGEVCDRINTALNACYAEILSKQYGVGDDILSTDHGDDIEKDNGLTDINTKDAAIGSYEAVTAPSGDVVKITWTANDADYQTPTKTITGKIEKKADSKDKVPYTVVPATVLGGADASPAAG